MVAFSKQSCLVSWLKNEDGMDLPCSVKGKLGGPSQRRLAISITSSVLPSIWSMRCVSSVVTWCNHYTSDVSLHSAFSFLWEFCWEVIHHCTYATETGAELHLAAYEAIVYVLSALSAPPIYHFLDFVEPNQSNGAVKLPLDLLASTFLASINSLLTNGVLTRSRRAVLMCWKWLCVDSLLSISRCCDENKSHLKSLGPLFSDSILRTIFLDITESLENASKNSVVSILRCVRSLLGLLHFNMSSGNLSSLGISYEMMMQLVKSSWILHLSCNKRRIAPIAAQLSAILHPSIFPKLELHQANEKGPGLLKWVNEGFPSSVALSWKPDAQNNESQQTVVFPKGNPIPSINALDFYRSNTFPVDVLNVDTDDLQITEQISMYTIGPFRSSKGEKAKLEVKVRLNIHGIVSLESATMLEEEEGEVPVSSKSEVPKDATKMDTDNTPRDDVASSHLVPEMPLHQKRSPSVQSCSKVVHGYEVLVPENSEEMLTKFDANSERNKSLSSDEAYNHVEASHLETDVSLRTNIYQRAPSSGAVINTVDEALCHENSATLDTAAKCDGADEIGGSARLPRRSKMKTALLVATLLCAFLVSCEGTSSYSGAVLSASQATAASEPCNAFALATIIVKKCVDLPDDFPRDCCAAVYLALGQEGCMCAVKVKSFFHLSPLDDTKAMDIVMKRCRASASMYSILHGCYEGVLPPEPRAHSVEPVPSPPPASSSATEITPISHPSESPAASPTLPRSSKSTRWNSCWVSIVAAITGWFVAAMLVCYIKCDAMLDFLFEFLDHDWYRPIGNEDGDESGALMQNENRHAEVQNENVGTGEVMQNPDAAAQLIYERDAGPGIDAEVQNKDVRPGIDEPGLMELDVASTDTLVLDPTASGLLPSGSQSCQSQGELGLQMSSTDTLHLPPTPFGWQSDKSQGVVDSQDSETSCVAPACGHSSNQDTSLADTSLDHCTRKNKQAYKERAHPYRPVRRKPVAAKAVPSAVPEIEMQLLGVEKGQVDPEELTSKRLMQD